MPVCQSCGHDNPAGNRFCASCGEALVRAESPGEVTSTIAIGSPPVETDESSSSGATGVDPVALAALEPGTALLVVERGPNVGSRFLLDASVTTVGRHPDSDIFLDDVTVSRRHAQFRRSDDGFVVADVGSLNGTYVNRDRIDETALRAGDEVQVGKYRLIFHPATSTGAAAGEGR
jgi:pSer/pThr/pTyr-binding forkhead associated (FHA) protein